MVGARELGADAAGQATWSTHRAAASSMSLRWRPRQARAPRRCRIDVLPQEPIATHHRLARHPARACRRMPPLLGRSGSATSDGKPAQNITTWATYRDGPIMSSSRERNAAELRYHFWYSGQTTRSSIPS